MPEEERVRSVFNSIYNKYDLIDSIISFGMDSAWRRTMITLAGSKPYRSILDCGAGTGKLTMRLRKKFPDARIIALDVSDQMISLIPDPGIERVVGSAVELPFEDGSFDLVTSAFLTRNVPSVDGYLKEAYRVLRKDGALINLDIHTPVIHGYREIFSLYFFHIVPIMGDLLTGSNSYSYLSNSVRKFVDPDELIDKARKAGFRPKRKALRAMQSISIIRFDK
ncbi:MAG: class I SAM-dependent methyltransferase [Candidatus Thermoplasmatota archaeon]|nr:class I SAM-dependent methyltransferase [Candidatus Thermoplasmatota archaeon]